MKSSTVSDWLVPVNIDSFILVASITMLFQIQGMYLSSEIGWTAGRYYKQAAVDS